MEITRSLSVHQHPQKTLTNLFRINSTGKALNFFKFDKNQNLLVYFSKFFFCYIRCIIRFYNVKRAYEHPYATRSKSLRTAQSSMNVAETDRSRLQRRQSDSSIVFLGTYRKVPQLVVLDESNDGRCIEFVENPEALMCLKAEKVRDEK